MVKPKSERQDEIAERLLRRMTALNISGAELGRLADTSRQQIHKLTSGENALGRDWAERLAPYLRADPAWLMMLDGASEPDDESFTKSPDLPVVTVDANPPGYVPVPFISIRAGMGGGGYIEEEHLGRPKLFEEDLVKYELRARPSDLRAITVEGQSMEPMLLNGDQVLVDTRKRSVIEPGIFVLFDGEGIVCKWVERAHVDGTPTLRIKSENPRFSPYEVLTDQVQIVGRVVWFARRL
ncbi:transcriptional regulator [Gluconacetobacter azotocaptans]|uniref:XRE family transcriptional regulator n=1 Tax=Gluconacetobacter azotocaptans TaxID=142834 RepID=UPI00195B79BE|nr:S24 family peptidase [Gluconacetobacter azotocaptans]MBM9401588.1 transcriptional regulator [Gluconacetobacter azotocaptans]